MLMLHPWLGIRYADDPQNQNRLVSISSASDFDEMDSSALTRSEDKGAVTDFCYILMSQFQPYCSEVPSRDNLDLEDEERLPSIGVVCRHCCGVGGNRQSKGVYLSSKAETLMRNQNLAKMYAHIIECVPDDVKSKLMQAKNVHLPQSDRLKKGWKKRFFERVCDRLTQSLCGDEK